MQNHAGGVCDTMLCYPQTYRSTPFSADEMKDVGLLALFSSYNVSYEGMRPPIDVAHGVFFTRYDNVVVEYNMIPGTSYSTCTNFCGWWNTGRRVAIV